MARTSLEPIIQSRPTGAESGGRLVVCGGGGEKINLPLFSCPASSLRSSLTTTADKGQRQGENQSFDGGVRSLPAPFSVNMPPVTANPMARCMEMFTGFTAVRGTIMV